MKNLVLIGGGNMGEAIISGLLRSGHWKPSQITVSDVRSDQLERLNASYKVRVSSDNRWAVRDADIILLAVKPQQIAHVMGELGPVIRSIQLIISIAAGVPTPVLENYLAKGVPVIRVMPNTPALVMAGAAAISRGRWAKETHEKLAQGIFSTVGMAVSVSEDDMDAVTALSGSGPAYIFYLAEAMLDAGKKLGLAPHVADQLVRQTIYGAGLLLSQSHEELHILRQRVTSPGGTTEAALKELDKEDVGTVFIKAIRKARDRARELSKT